MASNWEENQLLRDIVDGLNAAIAANAPEWRADSIDSIRFNKLLYLAVEEFDLDVTYRWYRYGADFKKHGFDESMVRAQRITDLPSPDTSRLEVEPNVELDAGPPSPRQVKHFYEEELSGFEDIFTDATREFLYEFYEGYAPAGYEELYAECAVLQKSLDSLADSDDPLSRIRERGDDIISEIRAVKRAASTTPDLTEDAAPFGTFLDLFMDVIASVDSGAIDPDRTAGTVITDMVYFFYENAWARLAARIGMEESHGPDAQEWADDSEEARDRIKETYSQDLNGLYRRCLRNNLLTEAFEEQWEAKIFGRDETHFNDVERRGFAEWKGASREASEEL